MDIKQKFGLAVRNRRYALDLSQEELGMRIEMTQSYVSLIETGQMNITLETVAEICTALECEVEDLFHFAGSS